jgi:hypothetical protein
MRMVSTVLMWLTRVSGLAQLALGLLLWSGNMALLGMHIPNGFLFVLLIEIQAGIAAWAGVNWRLVVLAVLWGLFTPYFGMTQSGILPGDLHWIVQIAHLVVGIVAMGLADQLARGTQQRLAERGTVRASGAPRIVG